MNNNHKTPDFERVIKTINHQEPDCVPLAELQIDRPIIEAWLGRKSRGVQDEIKFWVEHGYDFYCPQANYPLDEILEFDRRVSGSQSNENNPQDTSWAPEHASIIKTMDDIEKISWRDPVESDYNLIRASEKYLPDGMAVIAHVGGFFEFPWMLMGFETFSYALIDNPELINRLFKIVSPILFHYVEGAIAFDSVRAVWLCDDLAYTTGLMMPPDFYRQYVFPWHKKVCNLCKHRKLPVIYHSDGDLRPVIPDLIDNGINVLHPIEPAAMDIVELKNRYGDVLAFVGNVDLGNTLILGNADDVRTEVREKIKKLAPGGGYLAGSSNTIPGSVPLQNFEAMCQAVSQYGRYPITL